MLGCACLVLICYCELVVQCSLDLIPHNLLLLCDQIMYLVGSGKLQPDISRLRGSTPIAMCEVSLPQRLLVFPMLDSDDPPDTHKPSS